MSERLHDQIADCEAEMKAINDAAKVLLRAVEAAVNDFAVKYPKANLSGLSEDVAGHMSDIVSDLEAPATNRKMELEDEIAEADWADLRRSSPIVIAGRGA